MEFTTILGIIFGLISIIGAMIFKHISFSVLLNPAAFMVIIVGTVATILNAYPGKDLKNLARIFGVLFKSSSNDSKTQLVNDLMRYTHIVRREGLLVLEQEIENMENEIEVWKKDMLLMHRYFPKQVDTHQLLELWVRYLV